VNSKFDLWRAGKFTPAELTNTNVSGASANPDGDQFQNLLEYAMGLDPKASNSTSTVSATLSNGIFSISFPHYKPAADAPITLETSSDLVNWSVATTAQLLDRGLTEILTHQQVASAQAKFFRLRTWLQ
jgi:hypothetical protein